MESSVVKIILDIIDILCYDIPSPAKEMRKIALLVVVVMLLFLFSINSNAAPSSPGPASSLSVSVVPSRLPADGRSYNAVVVSLVDSNGNPTIAINDTHVFLTSSQQSVGTVTQEITIKQGTDYSIANFTTTNTPGTTVITASANGLQSSSAIVQTVTPSGFPTRLEVFPVPSVVLARPNSTGSLLIVVVDDTGKPARTVSDVNVTISSSDNKIVQIPEQTATINQGQFMTLSRYTNAFVTGTACITVSASGFVSGSSCVSVVGPSPVILNLYAQPPSIVTSSTGRIVVSLTDQNGRPARAPSDIVVTLTSSNLTVATVQSSLTISKGEIYAVATYSSTNVRGSSIITASSPGLVSSSVLVKTYYPTQAVSLTLYAAPNPVLADNRAYSSIVVSLLNGTGYPALSKTDVSVFLTSSSSDVGSVQSTVTIKAGTSFSVATFTSTYLVGSTQITASAQNLKPAQISVSTFGPIPAKVSLVPIPVSLPADGGAYTALAVTLLDASGSPAVGPSDIVVQLSSSRTDLINLNTSVVIKAGQSYSLVSVKTGVSPGSSNITASSSGYVSSSVIISTVAPAPSRLALYVAPSKTIIPSEGTTSFIAVQLQDDNGNPARARELTQIIVTASNTTVLSKHLNLNIPVGGDLAFAYIKTNSSGTATLTASSPGLQSSSASFSVLPFPLVKEITVSPSGLIYLNQTATFQVKITFLGVGLQGINVTFTSSQGTMQPSNTVTSSDGTARSTLIPSTSGFVSVTAAIHSSLIGNSNLTSGISVILPPVKPRPTLLQEVLPWLPLIVVAVFLAVIAFFVRRTILRRRRAQVEEETYVLEEEAPEEGKEE